MNPNIGGWSTVLAGYWNPMIIQPAWIIGRLTESQDVLVEYPVNNPALGPRFRFDGIILQVSNARIEIQPEAIDDVSLEKIQNVAVTILNDLQHTPQIAAGINFEFIEEEPTPDLLEILHIGDTDNLADSGFNIDFTLVKRKLTQDDQAVNLEFKLDQSSNIIVKFNFHRDNTVANQTVNFINQPGILQLRTRALEILNNIYHIEVDMEGDDNND